MAQGWDELGCISPDTPRGGHEGRPYSAITSCYWLGSVTVTLNETVFDASVLLTAVTSNVAGAGTEGGAV